jgi:hypothetical protein
MADLEWSALRNFVPSGFAAARDELGAKLHYESQLLTVGDGMDRRPNSAFFAAHSASHSLSANLNRSAIA